MMLVCNCNASWCKKKVKRLKHELFWRMLPYMIECENKMPLENENKLFLSIYFLWITAKSHVNKIKILGSVLFQIFLFIAIIT